ncbi:MAG: TonB-dependent receptor [Bacteroidales bacterium]|nr:TonB-dependent receptor [Bacteroidales bacterium]
MRKILYIILLLIINQYLTAQTNLSGTVINKNTGEKLPGVNVYIPELQRGTITDEHGAYSIAQLPKGRFKIQFSFVGYSKVIKNIVIDDKSITLNISLQEENILAEEIVVSGGSYATQHENAIKIESLSAEKLKMANSPSFIEAIAQTPGVDMISKGVGIATPVIRGLSLSNILMLNNGVRMENFQFSENHPFMVNESGVDRVEIVKGPASLLYGSDAIGGVINIIDEKAPVAGKLQADANINYYSNTQGINTNLGIKSTTKSNWFWILRSGIKSHKDYHEGGGRQVPNSRFNTAFIKVNTGVNKLYGKFALRYNYDQMKLGLTVPPAIELTNNNSAKNEFWYQDLSNHFIASNNTLFINDNKLEFNVAFQQNNRTLMGSELTPVFKLVDMQLNTLNYELKAYFDLPAQMQLIAGFHGMNQQNTNAQAPDHVLPDYTMNDVSFYSLIKYGSMDKFNLQFGLRYDLRFINVPEQLKSGSPDEQDYLQLLETNYDNLNGSLGATYRINKQFLLRANIATAYRSPNIAELTQDGIHGNRYEQGNRDLIPQKSIEYDFSMHYHMRHFLFDIASFYNQINDYIYLSPTNDTTNEGVKIYRYMQNNAHIYGLESGIAYQNTYLSSKISYAYLRGVQENNENLPFIPQNKINGNIAFQKTDLLFLKELKLNISGNYAFKQTNPAMFETETAAYFVLNSSLEIKIPVKKQQINFKFFANNILDKKYFDHLSTLKDIAYYNTGRNVGLSLSYQFGN